MWSPWHDFLPSAISGWCKWNRWERWHVAGACLCHWPNWCPNVQLGNGSYTPITPLSNRTISAMGATPQYLHLPMVPPALYFSYIFLFLYYSRDWGGKGSRAGGHFFPRNKYSTDRRNWWPRDWTTTGEWAYCIGKWASCRGSLTMASIDVRRMSGVWVSSGLITQEHERRQNNVSWFRLSRPYA
jgi:hypothetical protein